MSKIGQLRVKNKKVQVCFLCASCGLKRWNVVSSIEEVVDICHTCNQMISFLKNRRTEEKQQDVFDAQMFYFPLVYSPLDLDHGHLGIDDVYIVEFNKDRSFTYRPKNNN